jgi:hypothetical protein
VIADRADGRPDANGGFEQSHRCRGCAARAIRIGDAVPAARDAHMLTQEPATRRTLAKRALKRWSLTRSCQIAMALRPRRSASIISSRYGSHGGVHRLGRDRLAPDVRDLLDSGEGPAQTPKRADLMLFLVVQDVDSCATEPVFCARVNVSAASANCRFEVAIDCRLWMSTEGLVTRTPRDPRPVVDEDESARSASRDDEEKSA